MTFDARTQSIIDRLAAVDRKNPVLDKARAERAILEHFAALGIDPLPIRWVSDAESGWLTVFEIAKRAAESAAESAAWSAAWSAAESAAWSAAWSAAESAAWSAAIERYIGIWLPFTDAFEAGLWLFFPTEKELIAVPRPVLHIQGDALHCDYGPAAYWPNGKAYWFLNGVQMSREIVETPAQTLDPKLILKEQNAEIRREIVRKIGIERVCSGLNAKVVDRKMITLPDKQYLATAEDDVPPGTAFIHVPAKKLEYELLMLDLGDGRQRPYLKMRNPSIDTWHVEGVGVECRTVLEALHWRKPDAMREIRVDDAHGEEWHQQGDVCIWPLGAESLRSLPSQLT